MQVKQMVRLLGKIALGLALLGTSLGTAHADLALNGINVRYHGGPLIQHVKVVPLLYGSSWTAGITRPTAAYLQGFLQSLVTDGRYLAGLSQYSAGGYPIGAGMTMAPVVDAAVLPKVDSEHAATGVRYQVTDDQIQAEIKAQFSAGKLPAPDADMLYVVCVDDDTVVIAGGGDSESDFRAYHDYSRDGGYAYAVIAPTGDSATQRAPSPPGYRDSVLNEDLTASITHELVEAVTDPQGDGWYDDNSQYEIADIADVLNSDGFISDDQLFPVLTGADGTLYAVEAYWSNQGRTLFTFTGMASAG